MQFVDMSFALTCTEMAAMSAGDRNCSASLQDHQYGILHSIGPLYVQSVSTQESVPHMTYKQWMPKDVSDTAGYWLP